MSIATEAMGPGTNNMATALSAGLDVVDLKQSVIFTLYVKQTLTFDGFVFWLKADQLVNPPTDIPLTLTVEGSLHHATTNTQSEDENFSTQRIIFTAKDPVSSLSAMAPETLYMAEVDGYKYAFSTRSNWYRQADLYHYSGDAVFAALSDIVVDSIADLDLNDIIVSNSLPVWLTFSALFPLYPSYLIPDNTSPPYASVHIGENDTSPIAAGAIHDRRGSRFQLVKDTVTVTTYGVRNSTILDWLDMVSQYTLNNSDVMGIMNSPIPRDAKRGQVEISAIAQKKIITFDVNYYQARIRDIARQLILNASIYIIATGGDD